MTDPCYPIGSFSYDDIRDFSAETRADRIDGIARCPERLRAVLAGIVPQELNQSYRPGGWTVRQLTHHLPDSHMNGYLRFKLALTETTPTIKPYDERAWATLADIALSIDVSLALFDALHSRWVALLREMKASDFNKAFVHPQLARSISLDAALANYAWHGEHHIAHIRLARSLYSSGN